MLPAVEKIDEAEYFLVRLTESAGQHFNFNLNAFLSSARSVTFYLQSSMANVDAFKDWYQQHQEKLSQDNCARFFLDLRNVSQKVGPVACVGGQLETAAGLTGLCRTGLKCRISSDAEMLQQHVQNTWLN
jgi:hypothetical protein